MIATEFQRLYVCFRYPATRLDWSEHCRLSELVRNKRWRPVTGSACEIMCSSAYRYDNNEIPTTIHIFLISSNTTGLIWRLPVTGISLLSCVQAELHVISYALPVTGRHLWFLIHPDKRHCLDQSSRDAWHRNIAVVMSLLLCKRWEICYFLGTSGYRPPSLIYHLPWHRTVIAQVQ